MDIGKVKAARREPYGLKESSNREAVQLDLKQSVVEMAAGPTGRTHGGGDIAIVRCEWCGGAKAPWCFSPRGSLFLGQLHLRKGIRVGIDRSAQAWQRRRVVGISMKSGSEDRMCVARGWMGGLLNSQSLHVGLR